MEPIQIRHAEPRDREPLSRLRHSLWSDTAADEHARELASVLSGAPNGALPSAIFVAETAGGLLVGFLEASLRSHADGCDPATPVGFVEGWFVSESYRRHGAGARLLAAAEDWARSRGCVEMASDAWIDHALSQNVHEALGFEVVDRCVHYRKAL
jgi:aminoglycoside 6'-N-acetyltransferase I